MSKPKQILAFDDFLNQALTPKPRELLLKARSLAAFPLAPGMDETHTKEIQLYLEKVYRPAMGKVGQSFDDHGVIVDCIPSEAQPGAMGQGEPAREPGFKQVPGAPAPQPHTAMSQQLGEDKKDVFGNQVYCPRGFLPVPRITPERILRMGGLARFLQKAPDGGRHPTQGRGPTKVPPAAPPLVAPAPMQVVANAVHAYAHAAQRVNNTGGQSWLNVWSVEPFPGVFSLSQQWFAGGTGNGLQTIEGGWHVFPTFHNEAANTPRLFIFFTPDGYQAGGYNLMVPGFWQTDNTWVLGGSLPASTSGGDQMGFLMQWQRDDAGNWWLYCQGDGDPVAVGYYPRQLFGGGQLSSFAESVDFGGEVCGQVGARQTGEMGSGQPASSGWQNAAFQKLIGYFNTDGNPVPAALTPDQQDAPCYTLDYHEDDSAWGTYFFFGGGGCSF